MTKTLIYPIILILLMLNSCSESRSKSKTGILSEKQMAALLLDAHISDALLYAENTRSDEKHDKALFYYPSVLEKHGITKARMDSSVHWYMRNPAAYARVYEQVIQELEKRQEAEKKAEIVE